MYSFQPLIDNSNSHGGFYFIIVVLFIVMCFAIMSSAEDESPTAAILTLVVCVAIGWGAHSNSYAPGQVPVNEQVTGTFVGFQSEGWNERSGKTRADRHVQYVIYRVPGGDVMLQADTGLVYPQTAVLYKN